MKQLYSNKEGMGVPMAGGGYETKYYENIDFPLISRTATKSFLKRLAYSTMEETDEWFEEKRALDVCMSYELLQLSCLHYV